ncbi:MAG TPA: serine/threonine-protein kinase [Candidatus Limnocylindrales bacterium]|jgi:serine/threonine-protein kinase|nr:serine/threonine-protein kinase [Candidatus Limnocylindrales bacterium]
MSEKPLKMVTCPGCDAKVFIPGDLPPLSTEPCRRCGHPIMMPMQLRQFELRSKIASGGQGKVYRAFDNILERLVAIKILRKELENDPVALENFIREARACASLNHTNIIHIYNFDEFDGQRFLVMELADRGSLDSRIEKQQRIPELDVLDIGVKIASALDLALKHNLLHRDIKPGNILFNIDNEPKLVDFGLARSVEAEPESTTVTEGTPYYVAPEKIKRERETFLSDMYSLGCTLYHALTGHVPFEAPSVEELVAAHVHTPLTPPNLVVPEITQATSDALVKVLAKNPADRFLSYDEFRLELETARSKWLIQHYSQAAPVKGSKSKTSWWRRG